MFDDLTRSRGAALDELSALLDLRAGVNDVLRQLDRAQALDIVSDALDLKSGVASAIKAAGLAGDDAAAEAEHVNSWERTEVDSESETREDSAAVPAHVASGRVRLVVEQIHRVNGIIGELGRTLATDHATAPALTDAQNRLDELVPLLKERAVSRSEAAHRVNEVRRLLRVADEEIEGSGYGPRLKGVDNEVVALRAQIDRLFSQAGDREYSSS